MTDFRRPDLDLWDEEDDADDARPTIVAERPTADQPNVRSPAQRVSAPERGASGATAAARSSLVQRLIEQGELDEEAARNSAESLRTSWRSGRRRARWSARRPSRRNCSAWAINSGG